MLLAYGLAYGVARAEHRLVRYESGCIARGHLEGHARDLWAWGFRCSELRRFLGDGDAWEPAFAPAIALEETARAPLRDRPSVCSLPAPNFPSQGSSRPAWCGR